MTYWEKLINEFGAFGTGSRTIEKMKTNPRISISSKLAGSVLIAIILASFGILEYQQTISLRDANQSLSSMVTSLQDRVQVLSSPCAENPPSPTTQGKAYGNGTEIVKTSHPVFALRPGSVGTLCISYNNQASTPWTGFGYSAFRWKNYSQSAAGITFTESPGNLTIPPGQTAAIVYTVQSSNSASGSYGLSLDHYCGFYQLVVSSNPAASSFSDFPGLLTSSINPGFDPNRTGCISWPPPGNLFGFNGFSVVYLQNTTKYAIGYNITSKSVTSFVLSPSEQNITFTMGMQSFSFPIRVWFATGISTFSTIRRFASDPVATPIPGNLCDWDLKNQTQQNIAYEINLPAPGFTVNAPTLQLQPFSHGTFRFSILISNLTKGYYVTFLGFVVTWKNSPGFDASPDLGTYFPISVGSGQWNQNISGTCPPY